MNIVFTPPHIGSATHETRRAMTQCTIDNLLAALSGQDHQNCINKQSCMYDWEFHMNVSGGFQACREMHISGCA
jgi:hypothetical protein